MIILSMGREYVSELRSPTGLLFIPSGDVWVWRTMVEWWCQQRTPDSTTRALWKSYQQSSNTKSWGTWL